MDPIIGYNSLAMSNFPVRQSSFEGPLELLLELIEKHKLHVSEVSLSQVADEYVAYVKTLGQFPLEESAQFILTASTLLLIKSKSLLPALSLTQEEEADIKNLEDRLARYQRLRELSLRLRNLFGKRIIFGPEERRNLHIVFAPSEEVNSTGLLASVRNLLLSIPLKEIVPQALVKKIVSLEETIESLLTRLQKSISASFREFSGVGKKERMQVIVSFLAVLELLKQGMINARQERAFEDITMESNSPGLPSYH